MRHASALRLSIASILLLVSFEAIQAAESDEEPDFKQFDFKLALKKKTRNDKASSFDDDKILSLFFTPKITSRSPVDVKDYKLSLYLIGQSTFDKKLFSFIEVAEYPLIIPAKRKFNPKERTLSVKYNDKGDRVGFKYHSYIMVVKDKKGKTVFVKTSKTQFNKILDAILKLKKGDCFDIKGRKIKLESDHRVYR